jgi:hypothetical protein
MEAILETKTATILEFIYGLRGSLRVTFDLVRVQQLGHHAGQIAGDRLVHIEPNIYLAATAPNGWPRLAKRVYAVAPNCITSSSMPLRLCVT